MTLPTSTRVTDPYETDGVQRDFEFDFPAFYNADTGHYGIEVRRLTALDYEVIDKSLYDIFLNDEDKSGYIRFHVAPMAGDDIYIAGDTTRSQQLNLINYGRYSAQSIEKAFDLIVALIQEFVSKVDEETRQRILADQALRDFLLIKFNQFTAEVTTKIDKHIGDINGFMSSLIPMFVCIMRKEIANYAETGMMQVINDFMDNEIEPLITEKVNSYLEQTDFAGAVNQIVAPVAEYVPLPFESQKTYKVNQRVTLSNGDIVKSTVAGNTANPNTNMTGWYNFEGDQKLFNSRTQRTVQSFGAVSGQDCTQALLDAAAWSRSNKQPVYDFIGGNYKFSQQLDFSANGAGFVGAGPYVTTLTWQGAENTTPIVSDQAGKYPVFQLTGKTGTFKWGELVTGSTSGAKGVVRSFPWDDLQVQTTFGAFVTGEAVTGSKSSASGTVLGVSTLDFGASVQSVNIRGFNLVADFTRTTDQFNNPTNWFQACGIYINGARNHSKIGDLVVDGFEFGLYSRMNWMCEYTDTILTVNCKNGIIFDYETNNIKLGVLSVRRGGNAADVNEGVGVQFIGSYSFIASNPIDVEASYCRGIVVEGCHGVGLYGGDIENNDKSVRKIIIKGYEGADFANDSKAWSRGINLFGMRVHNCLGIQLENGAKQVTIGGNAFSWTTTGTPTGSFAVTVASGHTHIKDICYLETNDIFGQNETLLPNIPFSMQSTTMLAKELNKYHSIEAEISTTDVNRIIPIGRFPTNVRVNRVELIQGSDLTGTGIVDIGAGGTILALVNGFNFTPVAVSSTPFGYQNVPMVSATIDRGVSVAHVRIRSGSTLTDGKLKVKIYYSLLF